MAPIELILNQRPDDDAIDRQTVDLPIDLGIGEIGTPDVGVLQIRLSEPGALQVDPQDVSPTEIGITELVHGPNVNRDSG